MKILLITTNKNPANTGFLFVNYEILKCFFRTTSKFTVNK